MGRGEKQSLSAGLLATTFFLANMAAQHEFPDMIYPEWVFRLVLIGSACGFIASAVWWLRAHFSDEPTPGRLVIEHPFFDRSDGSGTVSLKLRLRNIGPGVAYAGTSCTNFEFVQQEGALDVSPITQRVIEEARKSIARNDVEIAAGTIADFIIPSKVQQQDFDKMLAKGQRLVFAMAYAYVTPATAKSRVEVAHQTMLISGLTQETWNMFAEKQGGATYKRIKD